MHLDARKEEKLFRGKDYFAASLYFKSYGSIELFGEAVSTLYRQMSYYSAFNGGLSSAFGLSGGLKKKLDKSGFVLWGAYLPANLVNPHGQELPDGASNQAYGLLGYHRAESRKRFDSWLFFHRELYNKDDPDRSETGISWNYNLDYPVGKKTALGVEQELEIIDNYYNVPGEVSWKLSSELSSKAMLSRFSTLVLSVESRLGGPMHGSSKAGVGLSAEIIQKKEKSGAAFRLMCYTTSDDGFAALYPYERPLYTWSVFAPSLRGTGLYGYVVVLRELRNRTALGGKARWVLDFQDSSKNEGVFSIVSEFGF